MKRSHILLILLLIAGFVFAVACLISGGIPTYVSSSFATEAYLHFDLNGKPVTRKVTNSNDLKDLKRILRGWVTADDPSCGFGVDQCIILRNGRRSLTLCPACDHDELAQVGDSNRYIEFSEANRKRLDEIMRRYGMEVHE